MPLATDPRVVRMRPARRVLVERGGLVVRGLREVRPKRLNYPKLAATLLRQVDRSTVGHPSPGATVLMPLNGDDTEITATLLADVSRLSLGAPLYTSVLDRVAGFSGRTVLVVIGEAHPAAHDPYEALAKALAAHGGQREQELVSALTAAARDLRAASIDDGELVIEERPGKYYPLDMLAASLKVVSRRWPAPGTRDKNASRLPLNTLPGWGAGGVVLSEDGPAASGRHVNVASLDYRLSPACLGLDLPATITRLATEWLETLAIGIQNMQSVVVSLPWLSVAGFVGAAFPESTTVRYPDQLLGWQPVITLLETLVNPVPPTLLVYGGRDTAIHLVAIWS